MLTQYCKHIYENGHQCGRLTTDDSGYCHAHKDPEHRKSKPKRALCTYLVQKRGATPPHQCKRPVKGNTDRCGSHPHNRFP